MGTDIQLDQKSIFVGWLENMEGVDELNACILIAKWHIYKSKLNNELVFFYKYLCELKYALVMEKNIALRNNNMQRYNVTWQKIEELIT
jgi:cob(I)alamin adenosyltransferase